MVHIWKSQMPHKIANEDFQPFLKEYVSTSKGAIVLCPGGGYCDRSLWEGEKTAKWLQSIGITAFVLEYRVAPYQHPAALSDVQRAIRYIRYNAEKYGIDKDKIAVMGFSAGGHLAATASVHYDKVMYDPTDEVDKESAKPNASILCYSVIDMGEYRHDGSRNNLLGTRVTADMKSFMSPHLQINEHTPEAFVWHTSSDTAVPVMNSLLYAEGLSRYCIDFELHVYPTGGHGMCLAENEYAERWTNDLEHWLSYKEWK